MKKLIVLALAMTLSGIVAPALPAKPLGKILRQSGLSPDDFDYLGKAERSLYETSSPRPGRVVSWTNPETKSHGTAKLSAMRKNCAYIQHFVFPQGDTKSRELRVRMCRMSDGKWLLAP